jgi:hypothetical protein
MTCLSSPYSTDGLDLSQSSLIHGTGHSLVNVGAPYQSVSSDLKEHWRTLEDAKGTPFIKWGLKVLVAWMEAELGELRIASRRARDICYDGEGWGEGSPLPKVLSALSYMVRVGGRGSPLPLH